MSRSTHPFREYDLVKSHWYYLNGGPPTGIIRCIRHIEFHRTSGDRAREYDGGTNNELLARIIFSAVFDEAICFRCYFRVTGEKFINYDIDSVNSREQLIYRNLGL